MENIHQGKNKAYSEQITLGRLAINASLKTVKSVFLSREQYEILYSYKDKKETSLEIRFDSSTLVCLFSSDNMSEGVYLFLDDVVDITHCIEYCNRTYPCDAVLQGWVVNNCLIRLNTDNKECGLLILPIKKDKGS